MNEKIYMNSFDQIKNLKKRGLNIYDNSSDGEVHAEDLLSRINYYNLINAYNKPFLIDSYKEDSNISEIHALYLFDKNINNLFFSNILILEGVFKTIISDVFSEKYGHKNSDYLSKNNFEYPDMKKIVKPKSKIKALEKINMIDSLIDKLNRYIYNDRRAKDYILHYKNKHNYIPLWVLKNVMTFGDVVSFFDCMKQREKVQVAKRLGQFYDKDNIHFLWGDIPNYLYSLRDYRNIGAHDELFYNYQPKNSSGIRYKINFNNLKLKDNKDNNIGILNVSLFSLTIILKLMLEKNQFDTFFEDFKKELNKLKDSLESIELSYILHEMDFVNENIKLNSIDDITNLFDSI